jgi:hypothetical protein
MRSDASQRGQATVELALCLPMLVVLAGLLIQVGSLTVDRTRVWHAAREAARVAVVDPDEVAILAAAERGGLRGLSVKVEPPPQERIQGDPLEVVVTYHPESRVPLLGRLLEGTVMTATAAMRIEQP